jgi:hypothetical protein
MFEDDAKSRSDPPEAFRSLAWSRYLLRTTFRDKLELLNTYATTQQLSI